MKRDKKRFIKLLMGKLELSRNEARDRAARVVCTKNKFGARDKTLKALGEKKRIGTISYAEAWCNDVQSYTWIKLKSVRNRI